jgi:tRNA dimethylallyltransferase
MEYNLISILGPTATGKTKLAAGLAYEFNGEIISADSRQVYKGMDIGTGKDLSDYIVQDKKIPYHLIDIIEPAEEFNLFLFKQFFFELFNSIIEKNKIPFLAGGTGLYLSSVIQNYELKNADFNPVRIDELNSLGIDELKNILLMLNSKLHNTTDLLNKERIIKAILIAESDEELQNEGINIHSLNIGIMPSREIIKERITNRLKYRLQNGMIEEVKDLIDKGISYEKLNFFGLEYKFAGLYIKGELNYNDMFQKLNSAIHGFAKRQVTWFKKMENEGVKINWIDEPDIDKAKKIILQNEYISSS